MAEPKPNEPTFKVLIGHKVKKTDAGRYVFTISSAAVDRDRDTIDVNGWRLDNYRKNPVVLFGHQLRLPPIGKAEDIGVKSGVLKAEVSFAPEGVYELADTVRGLIDAEILRATSVGFMPIKWTYDEERRGVDFTEQELYEFSIVPVPSNPEALLDSKEFGIQLEPLAKYAEAMLDLVKGPGLWIPRSTAERVLKIASGEPASVTVPAAPVADPVHEREAKDVQEPSKRRRVLRLVEGRRRTASFTSEQIVAVTQNAVRETVQAAVRHARGRLED